MDIKMIGKVARNKLIQDLFLAFQKQLKLSEEEISKFRHEAFLVESNEEQILKWENFMNLEEKPNYSLQDRIDRVLFTLQSRGSFTPDFLKEQAKIFMNGIIDIEELFNEYSFKIIFKDIVGLPPNLENFKAMLELNKPAHLTYEFKFRYNTHGQLEILTHGEMEQYTHDELYQKRVFDDSQLPEGTPILTRALNKVKEIATLIFPLKTDYYNVDIFNDNFRYLDEHKLEKNGYTGTAKDLNDEISKKASKTVLGRMIVGDNLTVDSNGRVSGNPQYTHPSGAGNNHIPAGGSVGQVLKNSGSGIAVWGDMDLGNYYTKAETDEKFKNYCPIPVGGVLPMWNETNPTSLYLGTTWELVTAGKYIQSGSTALQTGGSNSVTIAKANLPNVKLKVDSFSATIGSHYHHSFFLSGFLQGQPQLSTSNYPATEGSKYGGSSYKEYAIWGSSTKAHVGKTSDSGNGATGTVNPNIETLGSGTALNIQPTYITLKFWKRLT